MSLDLPGFAAPTTDAQISFRAVLEAVACPGSVRRIGNGLLTPPPLNEATGSMLLTLADADTPVYLAADCASTSDWIRFHCGAPVVAEIGAATFVVAWRMPELTGLRQGSDEAPEDAATLLLQIARFGAGQRLRLAGPGLRNPAVLAVDGLPHDFAAVWARNHALFPRGIDLVLCCGPDLVAMPRSVEVSECA
jgi:alpha-D-ribose 1-methylphosphonate 5-triphosphate synthase subunit PhnH